MLMRMMITVIIFLREKSAEILHYSFLIIYTCIIRQSCIGNRGLYKKGEPVP